MTTWSAIAARCPSSPASKRGRTRAFRLSPSPCAPPSAAVDATGSCEGEVALCSCWRAHAVCCERASRRCAAAAKSGPEPWLSVSRPPSLMRRITSCAVCARCNGAGVLGMRRGLPAVLTRAPSRAADAHARAVCPHACPATVCRARSPRDVSSRHPYSSSLPLCLRGGGGREAERFSRPAPPHTSPAGVQAASLCAALSHARLG